MANFNSDEGKPSAERVRDFHTHSDLDVSNESQHHTIGPGITQAASGAHNHDGANSAFLFDGTAITGSRSNGTALASVIAALTQLGITDSSTP